MKLSFILFIPIILFLSISCNESNKTTNDRNEPTIIQENTKILKSISNPDSLRDIAKQQDEQISQKHSDSVLAEYRKEVAYILYYQSNFRLAKEYFSKSEESYKKAKMPLQANQMLANKAVINDITGNYKEAIAIYVELVDYFKQENDSVSWASALGNIGAVYEEMGLADKAIYYDKLSLSLNLIMHDTIKAANKYNNIGVAFSELKNEPDSAIYYYVKAYEMFKNEKQMLGVAQVGNNLAMQYMMAGNFNLAKKHLKEAELVLDTLINLQDKGTNQRYYGELYYAQHNNRKAVEYFKKAMNVFKKTDDKKSLMETGKLLSDVYIEMGDYFQAIHMMQYSSGLKDTLMNIENTRIIVDMESKYQLNEKNNTIEILQLKEVLSKKQLKIQLVIISLLIIVFTLFIITFYVSVQKNKLKEKELRLELQNYILRIDKLQIAVDEKGNNSKTTEDKLKQFDLTSREIEVLNFIAQGYKNSEISEKLFISQNTIKAHIKSIYTKLDVRNRVEAVKRVNIF